MGLDTYAVKVERADAGLFKDVRGLCGGMFSEDGSDGSFRGKVYDEVVEAATGRSLYQELIPPGEVAEMSELYDAWLEQWVKENGESGYSGKYEISYEELVALGKFLRVCKENKLGLAGWW